MVLVLQFVIRCLAGFMGNKFGTRHMMSKEVIIIGTEPDAKKCS